MTEPSAAVIFSALVPIYLRGPWRLAQKGRQLADSGALEERKDGLDFFQPA